MCDRDQRLQHATCSCGPFVLPQICFAVLRLLHALANLRLDFGPFNTTEKNAQWAGAGACALCSKKNCDFASLPSAPTYPIALPNVPSGAVRGALRLFASIQWMPISIKEKRDSMLSCAQNTAGCVLT